MDEKQNIEDAGEQSKGLDYDYWGRMPGWNISEAAALLLDLDPDRKQSKDGEDASSDAKEWEYRRLHRILERAEQMKVLEFPESPREFVQWATSNRLEASEQLKSSVRSGKRLRNWKLRYREVKKERDQLLKQLEDNMAPKERLSILKLIVGMARAKYGHTEGSHKSVSSIHHSLDGKGIKLSKDTIKKYLDEADDHDLIDEDPGVEKGTT